MITTPLPANSNTPPASDGTPVWPMFHRLRREYLEQDEAGALAASGRKYLGGGAERAGGSAPAPIRSEARHP
ncbi:hypothetical protein [Pseudooceanicola onchidii]|uniref:hypothetical protein n=1 Tax=Pseudooceanicola onchidii TaxID=2562279 RepID=UPI0010AA25EC|nr:hypothetical protein [Pseudooceanicola onchidii]